MICSSTIRVFLLLLVLTAVSCTRSDDSPAPLAPEAYNLSVRSIDPPRYIEEPSNPPPRSTPEQLLATYFEDVYEARDSVLYAAMLDRRFEFVFLPLDADSLGMDSWPKRMDLRSTGAMFRDPSVTAITLNIQIDANLPSTNEECENCRQMETTVTLRVTTDAGGELLVLAVDSPQTFLVRPDPIQTGKWVVFRQIDRAPLLVRGGLWAHSVASDIPSCNVSWGCLKVCEGDGACTDRRCCGKQGG